MPQDSISGAYAPFIHVNVQVNETATTTTMARVRTVLIDGRLDADSLLEAPTEQHGPHVLVEAPTDESIQHVGVVAGQCVHEQADVDGDE